MIPLKLSLSGFCGIRDGLGRERITIDFEREAGGAALVALTGRNGRGKSTILDNMTPYPVMPSRAGADGLGAFSYYDEVYLPENHKELEWAMDGVRYRSHLVMRLAGKRRTEAYLHQLGERGWTPVRLADGTVSDGRMETYSRCVEGVAGSAATFFSTAFSAQQRRQLSNYRNGEIKHLLAELLRLDAVRAHGERAAEVVRLLRSALQNLRRRQQAQREALARLAAERNALGDTAAKAELGRQNRNVAAARLDAKRAVLAALRAEQAVAASHEGRRAQLLDERTAALTERQHALEALDTELGREQAALDDLTQRHAQRATRRETTFASLRAQRTTLQAAMAQANQAERAAQRLPVMLAVLARRERRLAEARDALARRERMATDLALAQAKSAAIEREAGQAALAAQDLRRRFALTAEVPCAGMALQAGCKLLADAHTAHALLPDAGAVVARLNARHAALAEQIASLRPQAAGVPRARLAARAAEARLARSRDRLAQCERQAARRDALAQSGAMLADAEARLAAHGEQSAAERAEDDKAYSEQQYRIATLHRRRDFAAQPSQVAERIDALLAALPPAFDERLVTAAAGDCEQAQARLQLAEQAQLGALREQDRAWDLATQHAAQAQACSAQERQSLRLERHLEDWSLLTKAFGNDGIIALAIDDAGPALSALANQLLLACYGPRFSVQLQTQLATAKGELREGFDITVHDAHRGSAKSVAKMSGGERIWINECLTRAMALYLAQGDGRRSATLFSDEADGAFDAQHKRRFMAMKREVLRIGGYAKEYFISHTPELAEMADVVIDLEPFAN
ncbi:DNA repair protein [Massilia sp. Root351]|uniref:DNA repair protein n=1 Tax=Massilia sp. Root351 TaxID=1736522 RepID=UPI000A4C2EBE|nr:DNA repair protein [Massilia sp. Root351]